MIDNSGRTKRILDLILVITLTIFAVIIISVLYFKVIPEAASSSQTKASGQMLASAIDDVYENAVERRDRDYNRIVNVTLPGQGKDWRGSKDKNGAPEWVVYSGMAGSDIKTIKAETSIAGIPTESYGQHCDGVCSGFARREELPELELKSSDSVESFWMINPCRSEVMVYYDNEDELIKLRFLGDGDDGEGNNFCCNSNNFGEGIASGWPDDGEAWDNNGRGCYE